MVSMIASCNSCICGVFSSIGSTSDLKVGKTSLNVFIYKTNFSRAYRLSFQQYVIFFPPAFFFFFVLDILDWIFFSSNIAVADTSYFLIRSSKRQGYAFFMSFGIQDAQNQSFKIGRTTIIQR